MHLAGDYSQRATLRQPQEIPLPLRRQGSNDSGRSTGHAVYCDRRHPGPIPKRCPTPDLHWGVNNHLMLAMCSYGTGLSGMLDIATSTIGNTQYVKRVTKATALEQVKSLPDPRFHVSLFSKGSTPSLALDQGPFSCQRLVIIGR